MTALYLLIITGVFLLACALLSAPTTPTENLPTFVPSTMTRTSPTFFPSTVTSLDQPTRTGPENENLVVGVPAGFKIDFQADQNNMLIKEIVPQNESVNDWSTLVTVQIFLRLINTTPEQYQETLTQSWFDACSNSETYPVANGAENGYNFVLWQLFCPLNPATQKVEYAYLKAIQGNESFYLVQVAFRHEPSNDEITQWMNYFKEVKVCDSRIPERACP
jgi:hypothetical protein